MFDYLIVGAGIYGATFARLVTDRGKRCLVIEKRGYVGGNAADYDHGGIWVNYHGGHIFHTNSRKVWNFANEYADFWPYRHQVKVNYKGQYYSFPINMNTLYDIAGVTTPASAMRYLQSVGHNGSNANLQSWIVGQVGNEIFEKFIKGYTEKQWQRECHKLPASIIKRIPIRLTWDANYFTDTYQGVPVGGYTAWIEAMLVGIKVIRNADFFADRDYWEAMAKCVVYTGPLDQLYDYDAGVLQYRSLRWDVRECAGDFQGIATVNYTDADVPYTRVLEYKHYMQYPPKDRTVIAYEYPQEWEMGRERYYPIPDRKNRERAKVYKQRGAEDGIILGGRLATYQYMDMHQVIGQAMTQVERLCVG